MDIEFQYPFFTQLDYIMFLLNKNISILYENCLKEYRLICGINIRYDKDI